MLITCNDIFQLPFLQEIKIVAGRKGLNRIISWVHVMENPQYFKWVKGGELLMITGVAIRDDINSLLQFIKDLHAKNISGLIINIGPYIEKTPSEVIKLADSLDFPVFELPFEVGLIDISQSICKAIFMKKLEQESMDSFMKDIIFGNLTISDEIINRAVYYGYNPKSTYYSFIVHIDNYNDFLNDKRIWDNEQNLQIKVHIEQIILDIMNKLSKRIISVNQSDSIIIMVPMNEKDNIQNVLNLLGENIITNIQNKISDLKISIGIGSNCSGFKDFRKSVHNAQKALKFIKVSEMKKPIANYSDTGIYRLLLEIDKYEEMTSLHHETLGPLINYDLKNSTTLVNTLEVFIEEGANLGKASDALFIHRNTLKYRVHRIEEILDCDLKNINTLFNFNIALKIGKFLKCI